MSSDNEGLFADTEDFFGLRSTTGVGGALETLAGFDSGPLSFDEDFASFRAAFARAFVTSFSR